MLDTLRASKLKLNTKKRVMGVSELKFLGHVISAEGVRTDQEKVKAILGSITYLTQYVPDFTTVIAPPLRKLTQRVYRSEISLRRN